MEASYIVVPILYSCISAITSFLIGFGFRRKFTEFTHIAIALGLVVSGFLILTTMHVVPIGTNCIRFENVTNTTTGYVVNATEICKPIYDYNPYIVSTYPGLVIAIIYLAFYSMLLLVERIRYVEL